MDDFLSNVVDLLRGLELFGNSVAQFPRFLRQFLKGFIRNFLISPPTDEKPRVHMVFASDHGALLRFGTGTGTQVQAIEH